MKNLIPFRIYANDLDMGIYWGTDEDDALDMYALDAGYESYAHLAAEHGDTATADEATEMEARNPYAQH